VEKGPEPTNVPESVKPLDSSWSLSDSDSSSDESGAKAVRNPKLCDTRPPVQSHQRVPDAERVPTRPRPVDQINKAPIATCSECRYAAPRHSSSCSRRR
jgi:hypothetical protein